MSDIVVVTQDSPADVVVVRPDAETVVVTQDVAAEVVEVSAGLRGLKGDKGDTGAQGPAGADSIIPGPAGADGQDGLSAYEIAVLAGFSGSESAWLASLVGPQGPKGDTGDTGPAGADSTVPGPAGPSGADGADGVGVPAGGSALQVLRKASAADYDTEWANPSGGVPWGTITGTLSSQTDLQAALDGKANVPSRKTAVILESDFYASGSGSVPGLTGAAFSSGTTGAVAGTPSHPGVVYLRDSTTAGGGYRIMSDTSAFLIVGGEKVVCTFQSRGARSTAGARIGFHDSTSSVPTDGVWMEIINDGTDSKILGRCKNNAGPSDTSDSYTLALNTWYTATIEVNSDATLVTFSLYNDAGTLLWQRTVSANIPTASGRETGFGVIAIDSSTDAAADIIHLDYLRMEINRELAR